MKLVLLSTLVVLVSLLCSSKATVVTYNDLNETLVFEDFEAEFGTEIGANGLVGIVVAAEPADACTPIKIRPYPMNSENITLNAFVLIKRGECDFALKVLNAQKANFQAAIVSNINSDELLHMGTYYPSLQNQITIPSVFVGATSGKILNQSFLYNNNWHPYVRINRGEAPFSFKLYLVPFLAVVGCSFLILLCFVVVRAVRERRRRNRSRLSRQRLKQLPTKQFHKGDEEYETCAICLDDYEEGETLRLLPCNHAYHCKCVDPWLTTNKRVCPLCKRRVLSGDENSDSDEDDYDDDDDESDEEAPLLGRRSRRRNITSSASAITSSSATTTSHTYGTNTTTTPSYGGTNHTTTSPYAEGVYNNSIRSFQPTAATSSSDVIDVLSNHEPQVLVARSAPMTTTTTSLDEDDVTMQQPTNQDEGEISCTSAMMVSPNIDEENDEYVNDQLLTSSLLSSSIQHNINDNTDSSSQVEKCKSGQEMAGNSNFQTFTAAANDDDQQQLVIDIEHEENRTDSTSDETTQQDHQNLNQNGSIVNEGFEDEELVAVKAEK